MKDKNQNKSKTPGSVRKNLFFKAGGTEIPTADVTNLAQSLLGSSKPLSKPDVEGKDFDDYAKGGVGKNLSLSNTQSYKIRTLSSSTMVKKAYGTATSPAIPCCLAKGMLFKSWSHAMRQFQGTDDQPIDGYYLNSPTPPTGAEAPYSLPSPMILDPLSSEFSPLPLLADRDAYIKAISSLLGGNYSQSPRLEGFSAVRIPFPSQAGRVFSSLGVPPSLIASADALSFDPLGSLLLSNRLAPSTSSSDVKLWYSAGWQLPWDIRASDTTTAYSSVLPLTSTYGLCCNALADGQELNDESAAYLEFFRQLCCSPILQLRASVRSPLFDSFATYYATFESPGTLATKDFSATHGLAQAVPALGEGGVSFYLKLILQDTNTGVSQTYLPLSFAVNFTIDGTSSNPEIIIPRGRTISNLFHPGFDLPPGQTQPIIPKPGVQFTWSINIDAMTWGSASAYSWSLAVSNPSSMALQSLL